MNGSTAIPSVDNAAVAGVHSAQTVSNAPDTSSTTGTVASALNHGHIITIEVDLDQRSYGRDWRQQKPFWKGFVEEYEDPAGYVAVAFIRAADDSSASRSSLILRLNEVVRRNGYLLHGAEDKSTGKPIEDMPPPLAENTSKKSANSSPER